MPDLPQEQESVTPTVAGGGGLPLDASARTMGGEVGQALEQGAEVATRIHRDAMVQINQTAALDASNKVMDWNQQNVFDPQKGVLAQNTGINAPDVVDKTLAGYDANVSKISQGLANPVQQEMFQRFAQEHRYQLTQHLNGYESNQINAFHQQVAETTLTNAQTSAVQNVNAVIQNPDPMLTSPATRQEAMANAANDQIALGSAVIRDEGKRRGLDPATTDLNVSRYESTTHTQVLNSLMSQGRDQDAKAYYDQVKGKLQGRDADQMAERVDSGSTAGTALRMAPGIALDATGNLRPLTDIYHDLDTNPQLQSDPKLLDQTERQVQRLISQQRQITEAKQSDTFEQTYKTMKASPNGLNDPAVQAALPQMDEQYREHLTAIGQRDIQEQNREIPDNSDAFLAAIAKATDHRKQADGTVPSEQFANDDITMYRGLVSPKNFTELTTMWKHARGEQQDASMPESAQGILSPMELAANTLEAQGFQRLNDNTKKPTPEWTSFMRQFNNAVAAGGGPKQLGAKGMQDVADQLMITNTKHNPGGWLTSASDVAGDRRFQSLPQDYAFSPQQLSPAQRQAVVQDFQAQGKKNPTLQQIYDAYKVKVLVSQPKPWSPPNAAP